MAGLIGDILNNARTLQVHSSQVETTGRNLAHVNDPNYARQKAIVQPSGVTGENGRIEGGGISNGGVDHSRSALLDRSVARELASEQALDALRQAADAIEGALGERVAAHDGSTLPDGTARDDPLPATLSGSLSRFFNSFNEWSVQPSDPVRQQEAFDRADQLTEQFRHIAGRLEEQGEFIDQAIGEGVDVANRQLEKIAELNRQIYIAEEKGDGLAASLRDSRAETMEALAAQMGFETDTAGTPPGTVRVFARATDGSRISLVDGVEVAHNLKQNGTAVELGNGQEIQVQSGRVSGLQRAANGILTDLQTGLDDAASQLVTAVNAIYAQAPGNPNFFDPAGTTAATIRVDPSLDSSSLAASRTTNAGANDLAVDLAELMSKRFSQASGDAFNGTMAEHIASLAGQAGRETSGARDLYEAQHLVLESTRAQRSSLSGVSTDEEVADLMRFQRAFEGSARVLQVLDELLETVVRGMRG